MKRAWPALLLVALAVMPGAQADVEGDCDVVIMDQDVRGRSDSDVSDAILVQEGDNVTYVINVTGPARHFILVAELGPYDVILDERNFTQGDAITQITGNTTFEGLPGGAAGTYRYRGEVTLWDGSDCIGSMLVRIAPPSLFTPVLVGALLVAGAGGAGLIVLIVRGYQDGKEIYDLVKDFGQSARHVVAAGDDKKARRVRSPGSPDDDGARPRRPRSPGP